MYTFSENSCILDTSKRRDVLGVSPNIMMIEGSHARVKVPHGSLVGTVCDLQGEQNKCTSITRNLDSSQMHHSHMLGSGVGCMHSCCPLASSAYAFECSPIVCVLERGDCTGQVSICH
jgi:hypothetical protein